MNRITCHGLMVYNVYVPLGLMVYNIWMTWINDLQRVDIMDKFVELYFYMVIPMVKLMSNSSPRVSDVS